MFTEINCYNFDLIYFTVHFVTSDPETFQFLLQHLFAEFGNNEMARSNVAVWHSDQFSKQWSRLLCQGSQMVYFQTENTNLGKCCRALDWKMLIHLMAICNILRTSGICYDHLLHFFPVLVSCTKKNLAALFCATFLIQNIFRVEPRTSHKKVPTFLLCHYRTVHSSDIYQRKWL
jgi:hypothetical protein